MSEPYGSGTVYSMRLQDKQRHKMSLFAITDTGIIIGSHGEAGPIVSIKANNSI